MRRTQISKSHSKKMKFNPIRRLFKANLHQNRTKYLAFWRPKGAFQTSQCPSISINLTLPIGGIQVLLLLLTLNGTKTLVELVNSSRSIHYFLCARIKRMTFRANIDMNIFAQRRARFDFITTATSRCNFFVFRVDLRFHIHPLIKSLPPQDLKRTRSVFA